MTFMKIGIESIGLKFPDYAIEAREIAKLNGMPEAKATKGLGCDMIGLCYKHQTVVDLAVEAARRALQRWGRPLSDIGMIVVGTESSIDESRPLSAWVAEELDLKGAVRSYEVKHACYGGTLALRQAAEWKAATQTPKCALVIAADVCLYEPGHPAEVTQGAGAVAMIVGQDKICSIDLNSYPYSEPCFDFWRPTGEAFPIVDSAKSIACYLTAVENCFQAMFDENPAYSFDTIKALCFHSPFPKMVMRAFNHLASQMALSEFSTHQILRNKVLAYLQWNTQVGNAYSASLWISVAQALHQAKPGEKIACFSYGSGFGAELFMLERRHAISTWVEDVEIDIAQRKILSAQTYLDWRQSRSKETGVRCQ